MSRRGFWCDQVAWRLCAWLGHQRHYGDGGPYTDRRGRQRRYRRVTCTRCGTEGDDTYDMGRLEWLGPIHLLMGWRSARDGIDRWIRTDCPDCRKPMIRFGRPAGDHSACDDIPF